MILFLCFNLDMNYDLEERTAKFSEDIIDFSKKINMSIVNNPLISQLVRSATSVGANYCEANGASSKKDFKNKIYICKKEIQETKYWLRIIDKCEPNLENIQILQNEAHELTLIFNKITNTLNRGSD